MTEIRQFTDIYRALPEDYKTAAQRIHRSKDAASGLVLPVLIAINLTEGAYACVTRFAS